MTEETAKLVAIVQDDTVPAGYTKVWHLMPEEWKDVPLSHIFKKKSQKNKGNNVKTVFTNSAVNGIIPQSEYFEKDIANAENTEGYFVVDPLDYVYNPRISENAPYGPFKRNDTGLTGIVSPLYTVLTPRKEFSESEFLHYYLESAQWHKYAYSIANYGARFDRMNITDDELMRLPIAWPSLAEQERIAEILMQCDKVIELKQKRIEEEKKKKEALIRRLLKTSKEAIQASEFSVGKEGTLKDVVSCIESGTSVNSTDEAADYAPEKRYVLKTCSILEGAFLPEECKEVVVEDYYRVSCPIEANTLLVSRMNTPKLVGACALCDVTLPNVFLPDRLWKVVVKKNVDPRWLNYVINSESSQRSIRRKAGGTSNSMKNISQKDFLDIPIVLPSYDEQVSIANVIAAVDVVIKKLYEEVDIWSNKKRALMQMLLTGIVRVKV